MFHGMRLVILILAFWTACGVHGAEGAGFLQKQLPLRVVATTPTDLLRNDTTSIRMSGRRTFTVVFSRAVIALGSDFGVESLPQELVPFTFSEGALAPGRFRWVTTSIARWDPIDTWPPDVDMDLIWNTDMKTYDGIPLQLDIPPRVKITTGPLRVTILGVGSLGALQLTDDHWDAQLGLEDENLPEVPPDGSIVLRFSSLVELAAIKSAAKVVIFKDEKGKNRQGTDIQATVKRCVSLSTNLYADNGTALSFDCAVIELEGNKLQVGTRYALIIPPGTRYSQQAGPLSEEVAVEFFGLRKFRIPFLWNMKLKKSRDRVRQQDHFGFVNGKNISLWLPHGLSEDTSIDDLKSSISLEWFPWKYVYQRKIPMDFNMTLIDRGIASITADFQPAESYKLFVHARSDVKDGYGLPLQQSEIKFPTSKLARLFSAMHLSENLYFDSSKPWDGAYPILSRGTPPVKKDVKVLAVAPKTIDEAREEGYRRLREYGDSRFSGPAAVTATLPDKPDLAFTTVDLSKVKKETGMMLVTFDPSASDWENRAVINIHILDYHIFLSSTRTSQDNMEVVLWVVDMKTGSPAEGVEIHVMKPPDWRNDSKKLDFLFSIKTDGEGLASFTPPESCRDFNCRTFHFWIEQETSGTVMFSDDSLADYYGPFGGGKIEASLTVDHTLVEPGDKVRLIGHVVERQGREVNPLKKKMRLLFMPPLDPNSNDYSDLKHVELDEYGTFEYTVDVGSAAKRRGYTVSLRDPNDQHLTSVEFIVGEPRIPSALLKLITPEWVPPGAPFTIEVQATSLLGGNIAEAEMTLKYTIEKESQEEVTNTATIVTNTTGGASYEVDISTVAGVVVGDIVKLSVTWIGPTRERLVEEASLRVQKSDKEVEVKRLHTSIVPGVEFGVYASVSKAKTEEEVKGVPIDISLYRVPDDTEFTDKVKRQLSDSDDNSVPLNEVSKCRIEAGQHQSLEDCRLTIPETGKFVLRGCLDDSAEGNGVVCGIETMGKTSQEWEDSPLGEHFKVNTLMVDDEIPYGKPLDFFVDIPLENFSLMVIWGNDLGYSRKIFVLKKKGLHRISIDIGDNCSGGCQFSVQLAAARQTSLVGTEIPTSIEFDPMVPQSFKTGYTTVRYENEDVPFRLNVTVIVDGVEPGEGVDVPVIQPGKSKTVSVVVTRCPGKPTDPKNIACENPVPASNAKVLVVAVDKAVLSVSGPSLVELDSALRTDLLSESSPYRNWWPENALHSSSVFKKAEERLRRLLELDPWTGRDAVDTYDGTLSRDINRPEEYFLKKRVTPVTLNPPNLQGFLGFLGRELQQRSGRVNTGPSSRSPVGEGPVPRLRSESNFQTTPLFKTFQTSTDGKGEVQFTAPDNLGTFVVRAYATTVDAQHGSGEAEVINRLPLSLTPSRPRLARVGDDFEAGTVITVSGDQVEGVPVTVTLLADPDKAQNLKQLPSDDGNEPRVQGSQGCEDGSLSCLVALEEKVITSDADGQVEVRFRFSAERLGDANITIRADVAGANDAIQMTFPILGQQEAVQISTSFAIQGNDQGNAWEEGLDIPDAVPGSGVLGLKAGVGQFPAVLATADGVMAERPRKPYAPGALANITLPHVLGLYGLKSGDEVYDRAVTAFKEGEYGLNFQNLTYNRWGLVYYPLENYRPNRPDVLLNAWGIWVIDQITDPSEKLKQYRDLWKKRLEEQFLREADDNRKNNRTSSPYRVTDARLALGPTWSPAICPSKDNNPCTDSQSAATIAMSIITKNIEAGKVLDLSVETRAQIALIWLKHLGSEEGKKHPDVAAVLDSFRTSFRTIGRTSYIAYSPESSSRAGMRSQALALLAFVRAGDTGPLVEKLVNHVASEGGDSAAVFWSSSSTKLVRVIAMAEYDTSRGSTNPDLALTVKSGQTTLLEGEFRQASDPVVSETTSFDSLGDNPGPLMFTAQGTGEVSLVATLNFIPARLLPFPTYRGLYVEQCIRKAGADGEAKGPCLSSVPLGAQLVITIQITSPDDLGAVTVRALMPGGIEPVDPLISGDSQAQTTCFLDNLQIRFRFWYWPLCPRQETRPAVVTFQYNRMRSGTNTIRFQAIAASIGNWILPPIQAFVDDQPEVMGLSPAGKFKICEGCGVESIPESDPPVPCPKDCSGSGICDLTKGVCECDAGFTGADCSQLQEN